MITTLKKKLYFKDLLIALLFFSAVYPFKLTIQAAGNCKDVGGICVFSPSDCPPGYEVDNLTTCTGDQGTVCCVINNCLYTCAEENLCQTTTSGKCPTGVCCKQLKSCSDNGGACFPSSTACYGGTENELPYSCGSSSYHCCRQSSQNECEKNGGKCMGRDANCNKILNYSCGEQGGTCCDREVSTDTWNRGLENANKAAKLPDSDVSSVLIQVTTYTFSLITLIGVLFFVLTGLKYILAGSAGSAEKSKLGIQHLILGVTVGLSGYIIIKFINYILGG